MLMRTTIGAALLLSVAALGKPMQKPVTYDVGGTSFEGVLVYDDAVKAPRPGLLMVPNWMGVSPANLKQAQEIAGQQYVIFVADMYGKTVRPKAPDEASKVAGAVKADRKLMRERVNKSLEAMLGAAKGLIDEKKTGAIGFCFGGTTVVELAKSGAPVAGVVSFHGGLDAPVPSTDKPKARILALHGADDPFVPPADVQAFVEDLKKVKADWTLVQFSGAVHSFTDPDAHMPGKAEYNPTVSRRAFKMMNDFFAEAFGP